MEKEILSMEDAAELFGVSAKTFIKLLKEEKVPGRKIGREWRFSKKALVEWLSNGDSQAYSSSEADVKEFFDEVAPEWEELSKNYYNESIKNRLLNLNILKRNMTIMDIGAGDGYISRGVAKLVKKVIAVDISDKMLKELKKKARETGIKNIETIESDGQDVPVGNEAVDVICANMYLHHIDNPEIAIKEMYRVLKTGGIIYVSDFIEHSNAVLKEKMHDLWPGFKSEDIKNWFDKSGFRDISFEIISQDAINNGDTKEALNVFTITAVKERLNS